MNIGPVFKVIGKWLRKNSTKILAGGAIAAELTGFYIMHKKAPVVRDRLNELPPDATKWEKFKVAAPIYLPAAIAAITSCGCVAGCCALGERKAAIAAGLYSASEATLGHLTKELTDRVGTEEAKDIQDKVAKELVEGRKIVTTDEVIATGKGDILFFEPLSGRPFTSNPNEVIAAANRINKRTISEMWVSVNEWFCELGLDPVGLADDKGWNIDHLLDIPDDPYRFPTTTFNGRPCFVISYYNRPVSYK